MADKDRIEGVGKKAAELFEKKAGKRTGDTAIEQRESSNKAAWSPQDFGHGPEEAVRNIAED